MTGRNRYAWGRGRLAAGRQDHPGLRTYLAHARGTLWSTRASTTRTSTWHRHRRTDRHTGPGCRGREDRVRRAEFERRRRGRDRAPCPTSSRWYGHLAGFRLAGPRSATSSSTGQVVGERRRGPGSRPDLTFTCAIYEAGVPARPTDSPAAEGMSCDGRTVSDSAAPACHHGRRVPVRFSPACRSCRTLATGVRQGRIRAGRRARRSSAWRSSCRERRTLERRRNGRVDPRAPSGAAPRRRSVRVGWPRDRAASGLARRSMHWQIDCPAQINRLGRRWLSVRCSDGWASSRSLPSTIQFRSAVATRATRPGRDSLRFVPTRRAPRRCRCVWRSRSISPAPAYR